MNQSLIIQLFLLFAKYATTAAIDSCFNKGESTIANYSTLKNMADTEAVKQSDVKFDRFAFGPNMDAISSYINNSTGFFLFVDYGKIDCETDTTNIHHDYFDFAVTVAYRLKEFNGDMMEQALASDSCLQKLAIIRNELSKIKCGTPIVSERHDFNPFIAQSLSSIGWTMMCTKEGIDSFSIS